jgi:hypothetical protein
MPDIAAISAILSSIKSATDIAKLLKDADVSLEKAELRLKLADLISTLADARTEIAGVQETITAKEEKIRALEKALHVHGILKFETPAYWLVEGDKRDGPFCQACYDKDRKLIRLQGYENGIFDCKVCNTTYTTREYRSRQDAQVQRWNAGFSVE